MKNLGQNILSKHAAICLAQRVGVCLVLPGSVSVLIVPHDRAQSHLTGMSSGRQLLRQKC